MPKFEKISSRDKVILVMLNSCLLGTLPPSYIPEVGMSNVQTIEEVRTRLQSFEQWQQLAKLDEKEDEDEIPFIGKSHKLMHDKLKGATTPNSNRGGLPGTPGYPPLARKGRARFLQEGPDVNSYERDQIIERWNFTKYMNDPDARTYDLFSMLDFYGRKRRCLEMGQPLMQQDNHWYRDQKHRLTQRAQRLGQPDDNDQGSLSQLVGGAGPTTQRGGTTRLQRKAQAEARLMRKEVEFRNRRADESSMSSLQTETDYDQTVKHTL